MVRLLVLLAAGLGAAWVYCRFTTPCYEARCECEVEFGPSATGAFEENLNTRLAVWQAELQDAWPDVEIARVPRSRLVAMTVRGAEADAVAARANGCAEALVAFTETTGVARAEAPLAQIHAEVEQRRQTDERLARELISFRTASAADTQGSQRRLFEENLARATADVLEQEKRVREAAEWAEFLEVARTHPADLGAFPKSVPESSEVRRAHKAWSDARGRLANLRTKYTEEHPDVDVAKQMLVSSAKQFAEALEGATAVAEGALASAKNQLKAFRRTAGQLRAELEGMSLRADQASGGIERLQEEKKVARALYEDALLRENEMRVSAGQGGDRVRVVRAASVPKKPLYPDPVLAYSIGAGAPLALWILLGLFWPSAPRRHPQPHVHHHLHDDHAHHHSHDDHSHHHSHDHTHHHSHDHSHHRHHSI